MRKLAFHLIAICVFAVTMLGAGTPNTSFDKLGHQLVCQCGCGQILLECNHVGCPVSGPMIEELKTQMATGLPATGVLNWFVSKYGRIVLAAPTFHGFDTVAWIVPFAALLLGTFGVAVLIRFWQRRHATLQNNVPQAVEPTLPDNVRDRIRRETYLQ